MVTKGARPNCVHLTNIIRGRLKILPHEENFMPSQLRMMSATASCTMNHYLHKPLVGDWLKALVCIAHDCRRGGKDYSDSNVKWNVPLSFEDWRKISIVWFNSNATQKKCACIIVMEVCFPLGNQGRLICSTVHVNWENLYCLWYTYIVFSSYCCFHLYQWHYS